jgi:hypothetical protein
MMLEGTFRRTVLPVGHVGHHGDRRIPPTDVIEYPIGMPGAHADQ